MELTRMAWPDVASFLSHSQTAIVPIGSTEQHGPTGPIGTDWLCADGVAKLVAHKVGGVTTPPICFGMAQHHMAFPGTITLTPATLIAVMRDIALSLARHGFERLFVINGHGGNIASLSAAFSQLYAERSLSQSGRPMRFLLRNWWTGDATMRLARDYFGELEGSHATPSELSVAWALGASPRAGELTSPAPRGRDFADADDFRRRYPDGRIGSDPSLAREDLGRRLLETAAEELADSYRQFERDA